MNAILKNSPDFSINAFVQLSKRVNPEDTEITNYLDFESKDEYFDWRDDWRHVLRSLVVDIRAQKRLCQETSGIIQSGIQSRREGLRVKAHNMFILRRLSKKRSYEQMMANRKPLVTCERCGVTAVSFICEEAGCPTTVGS